MDKPLPSFKQPYYWNMGGALLILLGTALAAFSNSIVHEALKSIPAAQLLFIKSALGFLVCSPLLLGKNTRNGFIHSSNKKWHNIKAICGTFGNFLWIEAIQQLQISDATTLSLTSALLTTVGAAYFFHEIFNKRIFTALIIGFVGVVLSLTPTFNMFSIKALLPLGSAILFSASSLIVKKISIEDRLSVSLLYLLLGMSIYSAPLAISSWISLSIREWTCISFMACIYICIQWSLIHAYTYATASFLAPFKFARYPIGLLIGVLYFKESLSVYSIIGGSCIIISCFLIQHIRNEPSFQHRYKK